MQIFANGSKLILCNDDKSIYVFDSICVTRFDINFRQPMEDFSSFGNQERYQMVSGPAYSDIELSIRSYDQTIRDGNNSEKIISDLMAGMKAEKAISDIALLPVKKIRSLQF